MKEFIAFRAALALLKEQKMDNVLDQVYEEAASSLEGKENFVKGVYSQFTPDEISNKISQIVTSANIKAEVQVIFQTVENLKKCIPNHTGDWYFTGDYPTEGGTVVVNKSFVNFMEGKTVRAY
jgi:amidophosphoribosyltransferase